MTSRYRIEELILPTVRQQLEDEKALIQQKSSFGQLIKSLRKEGAAIMQADVEEKAQYLLKEVLSPTCAGLNTHQFDFLGSNQLTKKIQALWRLCWRCYEFPILPKSPKFLRFCSHALLVCWYSLHEVQPTGNLFMTFQDCLRYSVCKV